MSEKYHTIKKAIVLAAGIGKRMQPLTLETPKPLVEVNGVRMIDTVIRGLKSNGINDIYVVVGYCKDSFYKWAEENPGLHIVENPYYDICNNISSLYVVREHLGDCIIMDGDQIIYNKTILNPLFSLSGYNAVWCEGETDEWLMEVENGVVRSCSRTGGSHGWQLYSISRWSKEDGDKLRQYIEYEFENGNRDIYWDDVPMFLHSRDFILGIREMKKEDVVEIDSFDELIQIDNSYGEYKKAKAFGVENE